jgi:chromosomal replication initiator protein
MDRVHQILRQVAKEFDVPVSELRGLSKQRHIARPRQLAYLRLYDETSLSYPAIGRIMGDRDHTTIVKGVQAVTKRLQQGEPY